MMPNEPTWSGHDAIVKGFAGLAALGKMTQFDLATDDLIVNGDVAIEMGQIALTITPGKGKPMSDKIKYLTVWEKGADGSWKAVRDISNSDLPPAK